MTFCTIISETSNTGCEWSFRRIQIVYVKSVMHISYYWKYPGYCMRFYFVFDVIEICYIRRDNRYPTTLILSSKIICVLWQMRWSVTGHSVYVEGVHYLYYSLTIMNMTSRQEHDCQIWCALVAAICQDPALKLGRVHHKTRQLGRPRSPANRFRI